MLAGSRITVSGSPRQTSDLAIAIDPAHTDVNISMNLKELYLRNAECASCTSNLMSRRKDFQDAGSSSRCPLNSRLVHGA